eukprot:51497-Chlamydomonas_euryale.AAC.12
MAPAPNMLGCINKLAVMFTLYVMQILVAVSHMPRCVFCPFFGAGDCYSQCPQAVDIKQQLCVPQLGGSYAASTRQSTKNIRVIDEGWPYLSLLMHKQITPCTVNDPAVPDPGKTAQARTYSQGVASMR